MPYVEPRPRCRACQVDTASRPLCTEANNGHCTNCCGCIRCGGDCSSRHIPGFWSLEQYAQLHEMTAQDIVERMNFKRVLGVVASMTVAEMCKVAGGGWRPPCKRCGAGNHWLTHKAPPKIAVTEYKEDNAENDNTSSNRLGVSPGQMINFERRRPGFQNGTPNARVPINIHISAEIEVAGGGSYALNRLVAERGGCIVTDGSVSGGMEICTGPAIGDKFEEGIEVITAEVRASHGYITDSCGLHLHFDARDTTEDQLYKLGFLWVLFEPQLVAMQPASRRNHEGGYCKPIGPKWRVGQLGTKSKTEQLGFILSGRIQSLNKALARGSSNDRYRTLNYCAYSKHKTVEVRLAAGSLMPHKIINWAVVCGSIYQAARTMTDEQIVTIERNSAPVRDRLLELILTQEARQYVIERQEKFKKLNTPEKLAKLFDPMNDYRKYGQSLRPA